MILGINESLYNIPRATAPCIELMREWYELGIRSLRPTATIALDPDTEAGAFSNTEELLLHEQNVVNRWLSFNGTEYLRPLINNNLGVEDALTRVQRDLFFASENGDDLKARTAVIALALRVEFVPVLNWLIEDVKKIVARFPLNLRNRRVKFEVANPDVHFWHTDWHSTDLNEEGEVLARRLGEVRYRSCYPGLAYVISKAVGRWDRLWREYITDSGFVYVTETERKAQFPKGAAPSTISELGATPGNLVKAARIAAANQPKRAIFYSWTWAGGAWLGWSGETKKLLEISDADPEGYANLVNRKRELQLAISAIR